jgi:hypothetical protein
VRCGSEVEMGGGGEGTPVGTVRYGNELKERDHEE